MTTPRRKLERFALAIDVVAICIFVAVGRRNHHESLSLVGYARTASPFLIGAVCGWMATRAWRQPLAAPVGVRIWIATLVIGMIVRRFVFDDGTATAFVIVATVVLGSTLNGWRLLARITRDS